jgi:tetratricopeptide (TPR) repeat protein
MEIAILWIILCFVAGAVGSNRNIGFAGAFFLSLFLSPLVGLIIAFSSSKKEVVVKMSPAMVKLIKEGDKLVKKGYIDEAIETYLSALTYSDKAPITNFKLAKLYSRKKKGKEALKHLEMSIQAGFKDFDKINKDNDLIFLRETNEFKAFATNGFKTPTTKNETHKPLSRIEELDKLNSLFEKGVLTKEEFENEKKRILSTDK